jgi:hypothetical protein
MSYPLPRRAATAHRLPAPSLPWGEVALMVIGFAVLAIAG